MSWAGLLVRALMVPVLGLVRRRRPGALAVLALMSCVLPSAAAGSIRPQPLVTWQANGRVSTIAVSSGIAYLGGQFTAMISPGGRVVARHHLAAVAISSGRLLRWNPTANGDVNVLRVAGGTVYAGGQFSSVGGRSRHNVAAISAGTGAVRRPWRARTDGIVDAMTVRGKTIYLGGAFSQVNGARRIRLAALSTSGALDPSWRPSADATVRVLVADPATGQVYAGGDFQRISGIRSPYLAALGTRLGAVHRFAARPTGRVWDLALHGSGLYAAVGGHLPAGEAAAYALPSGTTQWSRWFDGDVQAITATGRTVYVGGHFVNICADKSGGGSPWVCTNPIARTKLADLSAADGSLRQWNPAVDSEYGVWAIRATPSYLTVGGDFKHVAGQHQWHYAEFLR